MAPFILIPLASLLTTVPTVFSKVIDIKSRQSIPSVLPSTWTSVGCFTDISTSRTLAATLNPTDNQTIESCIAFCASGNYLFAGVEFGNCDSTIQFPSTEAALSDCNMACAGNAAEVCGGPNRLNVFTSNGPAPQFVPTVGDTWSYQGCYTDSTSVRTLTVPVVIPSGITPQSCTAACQSLGNFSFAGLEVGHECWCDNVLNLPAQHVSDNDCRTVCAANHTEYCGSANRIAVYHFTPPGAPTEPQACDSSDITKFSLVAAFNDPPVNGPSSVNLKVITVELVGATTWTILSACPNCCSEWSSLSLQNSVVFPRSSVVPTISMSSTVPVDGESPAFVASSPPFPGFQAYCTMNDSTGVAGSPPVLAFNGKSDAFSLCTNTTANGRQDVVFSPITGHPHYTLDTCQAITIQVIQG